MKVFQERLKELVIEQFKTQKAFAKHLGVSENQIHYWVTGKSEPDLETISRLCRLLNTDPNYLLGFSD